jgi:hypothetical protein
LNFVDWCSVPIRQIEEAAVNAKFYGTLVAVAMIVALAAFAKAPTPAAARDYDCADFANQAEAEEYLLPGDPYRLDADSDGKACEDLPCPCDYSAGAPSESEPGPSEPPPYELRKSTARRLSKQRVRSIVNASPRLDSMAFQGCDRLSDQHVNCRLSARGLTETQRTACHFKIAVGVSNRQPVVSVPVHACLTVRRG